MEPAPFFSMLMPVLNRREVFVRAVQSVLCQSFANWELVIVDNGSSDGTAGKARELAVQDTRIHVLECSRRGVNFARNYGILSCKGLWTVLLDSDNVLIHDDVLENLASILKQDSTMEALGLLTRTIRMDGEQLSRADGWNRYITFQDYCLGQAGEFSTTIRTEWLKNNLFPDVRGGYECCVWYRLAATGRLFRSDLILQKYDQTGKDRICARALDPERALELGNYYCLLLNEYGRSIRQISLLSYMCMWARYLVYNRIGAGPDKLRVCSMVGTFLAALMRLVPASACCFLVNSYRRRYGTPEGILPGLERAG